MLLITIWPIFALICAGFLLARAEFPAPGFWPGAERLTYFVLFPALLVSSLADAPVRDPALVRLGGAAVLTILLAAGALLVLRRLRPMPAARFGPVVQAVVRFNTYLALSLMALTGGEETLARAAVYLALAVPLVNVLAILALTEGGASKGALVRTVVRNPLILACLAGGALALTDTGLPGGTDVFLGFLGRASLPLGLLCVGAALRPEALRADLVPVVATSALRLLAMPLLAGVVARACGLAPAEALVVVLFSAVPTAPTAYVLTRQLKGDAELMAAMVTAQTLLSIATLPLVLWLV